MRDTGPGIPESFKDDLFARFTKVERPAGDRRQGAGMGLAVCKSMVETQGGRIWYETSEGKGSTFHVELPRFQDTTGDGSDD